jgi:hypothetical protein
MQTQSRLRSSLTVLLFLAPLLPACAGDASPTTPSTSDAAGPELVSVGDDAAGDDAGYPGTGSGFGIPDATASQSADVSIPPLTIDAGSGSDASPQGVPEASCTQPLGSGVLIIDELMIESVAGTGDYGEWLEVRSTSTCAVNLNGLHGECPVGMKLHTFDVTQDTWLTPGGTFVVADSADPAVDHYLPGLLVTWTGQPGDVLRNQGATVTLTFADALVDTVTYPAFKLQIGASIAFPSSCPLGSRSDWTSWQTSTWSWFPGFYGTPNAPNDDVSCPPSP